MIIGEIRRYLRDNNSVRVSRSVRDLAYKMVAQTVLGSGKLMLETGKHPGELKDMVCSPGGTTICGVKVLEAEGMRGAIMGALDSCIQKSKKL